MLPLVAARHLRTLGNFIATNREVRKILSDFSVIGRDILARTASHAAERIRPTEEALKGVDLPAPSDQAESAGGKTTGPEDTAVTEVDAPATSAAVRHHPQMGTEIERKGKALDASQGADEARERGREVVDEAKAVSEYVSIRRNFILSFLLLRY